MSKPLLLDLFCGAGGASEGYFRAGFDVVGVDISPQKHYPFRFIQMDSFSFRDFKPFNLIHASPPCKSYSRLKKFSNDEDRSVIDRTRTLLESSEVNFVIENVPFSTLNNPVVLCGSMFDLDVRRHRLFETSFKLDQLKCDHNKQDLNKKFVRADYHSGKRVLIPTSVVSVHGRGHGVSVADQRKAMGIDWMTQDELSQAIPPAYTEWIGSQFLQTY